VVDPMHVLVDVSLIVLGWPLVIPVRVVIIVVLGWPLVIFLYFI
jgi:hypothetical protein